MLLELGAFGIKNNTISLVVDLVILFLVVMWLALVYWTYADARRRIVDPMLIGCATAASLFPFVGTIIYLARRPPESLEDVREGERETRGHRRACTSSTRRCVPTAATGSSRTSSA